MGNIYSLEERMDRIEKITENFQSFAEEHINDLFGHDIQQLDSRIDNLGNKIDRLKERVRELEKVIK